MSPRMTVISASPTPSELVGASLDDHSGACR